ncbi:MAG: translocation/assembly module TamB domain-containing protein, partial [bacterium]
DLFNAYRFDIDEGTLSFEGGQDFNPRLDIKAKHTIRTQSRDIIELSLQVTGRMFAPNLAFSLNGEEVETYEAVRYLVTGGRGKGAAQGSGLFAANGKEATGMLAGLLTSQLSRFLLNNQVLDVLEVKGDLTGDQASIVLGKYITNKLFLSLEKALKVDNSNDQGISDEVTIEYALSRYIILQAIAGDERTTGFDIFWKFSK